LANLRTTAKQSKRSIGQVVDDLTKKT